MRKSEYVLGRKPVRERLERNGEVTVAAVQCNAGTRQAWVMFLETGKTGKQKFPVLYRIRVRLKRDLAQNGRMP